MADSAMVLSLSQQPESFGRTVLEALALGRAVVGYDHGGVGEILADLNPRGRTPVDDWHSLVARVKQQLVDGPTVSISPSRIEAYSLDLMQARTIEVYESLSGR
jgi:glycosyltransferase involved in cell wall biosynthesis